MQRKANIAIIAGQLVVGGAERQLYLWLANLDRERFDPIVITLHPGHGDYWEAPIEDLGIPLFRVDRGRSRLSRLLQILRVIRPHHPDLIHGWHTFASAYAGAAAKILVTRSLGGVRSSFRAIEHSWETRLTRMLCDAVLFNAKSTAHAYRQSQKWRSQIVYTVQNAVDTNFEGRDAARAHLVQAYGLPEDALWVVSIGRVDPLKRFDLLLQLAAKLKTTNKHVHFLLIGDGPEKANLDDLSRELGVQDCFTFTGEVPFASRWMKGFDMFCFPSVDEGLPNVVMEAGAAGLPVVAWRLPFNEELLQNEIMALLVPPEDLDAMANALMRLIDSPNLRHQLGEAAKSQILSRFRLDRYIQEMTAVYEDVLGDRFKRTS